MKSSNYGGEVKNTIPLTSVWNAHNGPGPAQEQVQKLL